MLLVISMKCQKIKTRMKVGGVSYILSLSFPYLFFYICFKFLNKVSPLCFALVKCFSFLFLSSIESDVTTASDRPKGNSYFQTNAIAWQGSSLMGSHPEETQDTQKCHPVTISL